MSCMMTSPINDRASAARVVSLYESILGTDVDTLIRILSETRTDTVFRAYFRWNPDTPSTYSKLQSVVSNIHASLPQVTLMGGLTAAAFTPVDHWPNGATLSAEEVRNIAWTLPNGETARHVTDPSKYVFDITKPLARQFILAYAYQLVDAGFGSLFFDEVNYIPYHGRQANAPYVNAWQQIASSLKNYALTKHGKTLPVAMNGGWSTVWPCQDFITVSVSMATMTSQVMRDNWDDFKNRVMQVHGHLPQIMYFIDWGGIPTPLSTFASLSQNEQIKMIRLLHETSLREHILFVYPIHGGVIAKNPIKKYDAIQQGTYDTIKQLTTTP